MLRLNGQLYTRVHWIYISTRHFILELIFLGIVRTSALIDGSSGADASDSLYQVRHRREKEA